MNPVCNKGAISSSLSCLNDLPIEMTLYEIIDNKQHSNSDSIFIDIDAHNKTMTIGYNKSATKDQINSLVKWYEISEENFKADKIATRATGSKLLEYSARGHYTHISKDSDKKYFQSSVNTHNIYDALDPKIDNEGFDLILKNNTSGVEENKEIAASIQLIFNNIANPFCPKTLFLAENITNEKFLNYFKKNDELNQDNIIKNLRIKYFKEIKDGKLNLFIKLPDYEGYFKIDIEGFIDVIGFTDPINEHITKIYIPRDSKKDSKLISIFEINDNEGKFYKYIKNGNSTLREKLEDEIEIEYYEGKGPDFILTQYNVHEMKKGKEERKKQEGKKQEESLIKKNIIGESLELYTGLYIMAGGIFISSNRVRWDVTNRNLKGNKNYRAVLEIISKEGKTNLGLSGLKAQFDLTSKPAIHNTIKTLTDIYTKYINLGMPEDSDEYCVVNSSAKKSDGEKILEGYFYIAEIGINFYKFGISSNKTRIYDYIKETTVEEIQQKYPFENQHKNAFLVFLSLHKLKNVMAIEQNVKAIICESEYCVKYDTKNGNDIMEYFHCDSFYEDLFPEILKELKMV
jgi:hypothetical protein